MKRYGSVDDDLVCLGRFILLAGAGLVLGLIAVVVMGTPSAPKTLTPPLPWGEEPEGSRTTPSRPQSDGGTDLPQMAFPQSDGGDGAFGGGNREVTWQ